MKLAKATIIPQDKPGEKIRVMYNPSEITDAYQAMYTEGPGGQELDFDRLTRNDFTVRLFYDTYEQGSDVRLETKKIAALMTPRTGTGVRKRPPIVRFVWSKLWFTGVITRLDQNFTMFLPSGAPVRAWVTVTFHSSQTPEQQLKDMGYFNCRGLWQVRKNDRLDLIAQRTLGRPSLWRLIAEINEIDNPLNFPTPDQTGRLLVIPDIHNPKLIEAVNDVYGSG